MRKNYFIQAMCVYPLWFLVRALGANAGCGFLACVARIAAHLPIKAVQRIDTQLDYVWPHLDARARKKIRLGVADHLGRVAGEMIHFEKFTSRGAAANIRIHGLEYVQDLLTQPAIYTTAHIGNWELMAPVLTELGVRVITVYRAMNNKWIEPLIQKPRERRARYTPKGTSGARELLRVAMNGESLGLIVDQKMSDGIAVPFLGRTAMTAPAIAHLARKFNLPIIPLRVMRGKNGFDVYFEPALMMPDASDPDPALTIMTRINDLFSQWITVDPDKWMWVHRRWGKINQAEV